jgi:Ni/Co efflux regulator RcnB
VVRRLVVAALLTLFVAAAVALSPDTEAVLTLEAAVLLGTRVLVANRWANRRQREEAETSTQPRGTIPFSGWRNGGP